MSQTTAEEIVKAANLVDTIENLAAPLPPVVRNNLDKVVFFIGAYLVYGRIAACAGQSCGLS